MKIHVRYFASLREKLGEGGNIDLPENSTIGDLKQHLCQGSTTHMLLNESVLSALNFETADDKTYLQNNDEVAFFPPVTGG